MNRTMRYAIIGVVLVAAIGGLLIWRPWSSDQAQEGLRSAVVERRTLLVTVTASGRVEPQERVQLAFETGGEVTELPLDVGDVVEAGDALASLDADRLALELDQARASLAAAEAQLENLRAGPQPEDVAAAEANLQAAKAQVVAAVAQRDQVEAGASAAQIAEARAEYAAALTEHKKAKDRHDNTMKCFKFEIPGTGEKMEICPLLGPIEERARYEMEAAYESLEAAQAQLDETKAGSKEEELRSANASVWSAAAQRDASQAELELLKEGPTEEQIASAEARVAQARAALEQAELALDQATLEAPFDGIVAAVDVRVGERAVAGQPVITLIDTTQFHVAADVDEIDVGQLAVGQTARVTLDALPEAVLTGTVDYIASEATRDGGVVTYDITVGLASTDEPIRADMTANVTVEVEERADVLTIPTWAVQVDRDNGQTYVQRRVADQIERVNVDLGARYRGVVEVKDGLAEGDEVVRAMESASFEFGQGE